MAVKWNDGDRVTIVDRNATADDAKSGLYYNFFRGVTGTVQKVYGETEVAVSCDLDSFPPDVAQRHQDVREQMKARWLDGLSEEARGKLTEEERNFNLRYTVLVAPADLQRGAADATPAAGQAPTDRVSATALDAAEEAELQRRKSRK